RGRGRGDPGERHRAGADRDGDERAGPAGAAGAERADPAGRVGGRDRRGGGVAAVAGLVLCGGDDDHGVGRAIADRGTMPGLLSSPTFLRLWALGGIVNAMRWVEMLAAGLFTF